MRAIATLEIRDADKLDPVGAQALARKLATRKSTGILKQGKVRAVLRVRRVDPRQRLLVATWLEEQGVKLIYDRAEYAGTYRAKLYQ